MVSRTLTRRGGYRIPRSFMERATIATTLCVWAIFFTVLAVRQPRTLAPEPVVLAMDAVPDEVPYVPAEDPSFVTDDLWGSEAEDDGVMSKREVGAGVTDEGVTAAAETQKTQTTTTTTTTTTTAAATTTTTVTTTTAAPTTRKAATLALTEAAQKQTTAAAPTPAPAAPAAALAAAPPAPVAAPVAPAPTPPKPVGPGGALSCFTARSSAAQRTFTPSEKALFGRLFAWPETLTSACKRLLKFGGHITDSTCLRLGQREVCLDQPMRLAQSSACLVYSFSVRQDDWSFDEAMAAAGCEVHSFNPRLKDVEEGAHSAGVTFHRLGIGRNSHTNVNGWEIRTLDQIMRQLGHIGRPVTYLKMDADGGEFDMLAQQMLDNTGEFVLDQVEQMGLEVHFRLDPRREFSFYQTADRSVAALGMLGFNVVDWKYNQVMWERYMFPGVERPVSLLYEILLVKNGPDSWDRAARGKKAGLVENLV